MRENMKELWIKEWFYNKIVEVSKTYNTYPNVFERDETGCAKIVDGYISVIQEDVISETEKAIQVMLMTGDIGSVKGWKTWIPKSVIRN